MLCVGRPPLRETKDLPQAYNTRLPISLSKYNDLMICKTRVVPTAHHTFFEGSPHHQKMPNGAKEESVKENSRKRKRNSGKKEESTKENTKRRKNTGGPKLSLIHI